MSLVMRFLLAGSLASLMSVSAFAEGTYRKSVAYYPRGYVNIGTNHGGQVLGFARQALKWKRNGTRVRFSGRCASACTLYLSLAPKKMCITPSASFHFHAPYGANAKGNRGAKAYMLRTYPSWVRSYISNKGGLSSRMISMNYGYASRFIKTCGTKTAQSY